MGAGKDHRTTLVPAELCDLIGTLQSEERAKVEALFETALSAARERKIIDVWGRPELACSYWILMVSSLDDHEETKIAETVLKWKAFAAKDSACLECLQASDRECFRCCTKAFQITGLPSLILSSSPEMPESITFGPQLLRALSSGIGTLQRFLTSLHAVAERSGSLVDVRSAIQRDDFWMDLQITPSQARSSISSQPTSGAQFDVFVSHNGKDKQLVRTLADQLRDRGIRVWLDDAELIPGRPWQDALEEVIKTTRTAMVVVGEAGIGPWEAPEMRSCIVQFVERRMPVIPVLLPGALEKPDLPLFLSQYTWVDLRGGMDKSAIDRWNGVSLADFPGPDLSPSVRNALP